METVLVDPGSSEPTSNDAEYTPLDMLYIEAMGHLLRGVTTDEAAAAVNISSRHLRRWKNTPRWKELARELYGDVIDNARAQLVGLTGMAVRTIKEVMQDAETKGAPTRLAAAIAVIDRAATTVGPADDKQIRRIITRFPQRQITAQQAAELPELPEDEPEQQSPTLNAPEYWDIPQSRRSVRDKSG
jgi:hypothetical protein